MWLKSGIRIQILRPYLWPKSYHFCKPNESLWVFFCLFVFSKWHRYNCKHSIPSYIEAIGINSFSDNLRLSSYSLIPFAWSLLNSPVLCFSSLFLLFSLLGPYSPFSPLTSFADTYPLLPLPTALLFCVPFLSNSLFYMSCWCDLTIKLT